MRLNAETAPDAPGWWKERVLPILQSMLGDTAGALDRRLTFAQNMACAVATVRVQMPREEDGGPVIARATRSTALAVPNTGTTIVDFATVGHDPQGAITTGASWKFTAPSSGWYAVSAHTRWDAIASAGQCLIEVYVDGVQSIRLGNSDPAAGATNIGGSTLVELAAGQYFDIRASHTSSTGSRNLNDGNGRSVYVNVNQISGTAGAPDCFPLPFKATINGKGFKPRGVTAWNIRDAETGKEPILTGPVSLVWDWDGTDKVRLLDVTGLAYGHAYDITLAVFAG
jgi:hypothetical protein